MAQIKITLPHKQILNSMGAKKGHTDKISDKFEQSALFHETIDYGIDVQMLIDNLRRTPTERIRRHQIALDTMKALQKAKRL